MKKIIAMLLTLMLALALAGCTDNDRDGDIDSDSSTETKAHIHVYDQEIADDEYYAFAAEDENGNIIGKEYYYSCLCGAKGITTFVVE